MLDRSTLRPAGVSRRAALAGLCRRPPPRMIAATSPVLPPVLNDPSAPGIRNACDDSVLRKTDWRIGASLRVAPCDVITTHPPGQASATRRGGVPRNPSPSRVTCIGRERRRHFRLLHTDLERRIHHFREARAWLGEVAADDRRQRASTEVPARRAGELRFRRSSVAWSRRARTKLVLGKAQLANE